MFKFSAKKAFTTNFNQTMHLINADGILKIHTPITQWD